MIITLDEIVSLYLTTMILAVIVGYFVVKQRSQNERHML